MRRSVFAVVAGIGCVLLESQVHAEDPVQYLVANYTAAGDTSDPIITDVTFTNLSLSEHFSDGFPEPGVLLYDVTDPTHTATNSLDTTTIDLSDPFFVSPHGTLQSATLTGTFSPNSFEVATVGTNTFITVSPNFTATLTNPDTGTFVDILAIDPSTSKTYAAGIFGIYAATVPEPAAPIIFCIASGAIAFLFFKRQRTA